MDLLNSLAEGFLLQLNLATKYFSSTSLEIFFLPTVIKAFVNFFSVALELLDIQNSRLPKTE